jgi:signal transduction histidine kinase
MSHELRTPLNGVIGMAELLGYGPLDDEQQQQLQMLTNCATELLDLIDAVLEFTASEAEPPALACVPFDLTSLATDLAGSSRPAAVAKGLRLQVHVAPDIPPQVVGDPARLRQALRLLLDNAVRFTDEGLVALTITRGRELPDAVEVRCAVADTGVGIRPAELPRLLQPFTQADESAHRRVGGTGLGLARCGQLVRLLGARLEADSTPGEGSCFWFTLRLRRELPGVAPAADVTERRASSDVADDGAIRRDDRAVERLLAGGPPILRAAPLLLES